MIVVRRWERDTYLRPELLKRWQKSNCGQGRQGFPTVSRKLDTNVRRRTSLFRSGSSNSKSRLAKG